jgi:Glycoside hydrolase family 44
MLRRLLVLGLASLVVVAGLYTARQLRRGRWRWAPSARAAEQAPGERPAAGRPPSEQLPIVEPVLDAVGGLGQGWMDFGYSKHQLRKGGPSELDLADYGGLILARQAPSGPVGGLTFKIRAPSTLGDFLEVSLQLMSGEALARVRVETASCKTLPDGFCEVFLPIEQLNPAGKAFQRIMFFAWKPIGHDTILLDQVGLTKVPPPRPEPARNARFTLDCAAPGFAISPMIYGVGGAGGAPWETGTTAYRWGGNPTTRYNWELNTYNVGSDWFFRNGGGKGGGYQQFLDENRKRGVKSALTVPMIGWVAKDSTSYSFPVSVFGPQQANGWDVPDSGNGIGKDKKPLVPGPPTRTSVAAPPEFIERWVRKIREGDGPKGRSVQQYILDNEPMLWNTTHRDVHPDPVGYDELLERTIAYASAVRRADPEATIAGPAEWGWLSYRYSAKDAAAGIQLRPDRRAHGDLPLIPWYLQKLREHEKKTGTRLLDVLDVHFYPMGNGIGSDTGGDIDPDTAARRIRATRSLWDPTYKDESWIDEPMRVLPLLREWVAQNHPGLAISIGEWSFGAERHMSGGLATAEALGRFGTERLDWGFYWTIPEAKSPAWWAFRAYRNFDGEGGRFLDRSVPVQSKGELASLFASQDEARRHLVAVLLNQAPLSPLSTRVELSGCGPISSARSFTYAGGDGGFAKGELTSTAAVLETTAAPYSITVLDLVLAPAAGAH